jgi:hypothetical protein
MTTNNHNAQFVPPSGAIGKQPVQVGEVQGDAHDFGAMTDLLGRWQRNAAITPSPNPVAKARREVWVQCLSELQAALAARQPVGRVTLESLLGRMTDDDYGHACEYGGFDTVMPIGRVVDLLNAAPPAQGIDLGPIRELLDRRRRQWKTHLPQDPNAPGTRAIRTIVPPHGIEGETDYNNDVALYREGIAVMDEVLALIDVQRDAAPGVGNG